ncbi:MAG: CoA transferase subunit A [Rhodospirillaceae bacterium]|nr:CoA transferase subunit A [Rhodospirillaceae bacterium]
MTERASKIAPVDQAIDAIKDGQTLIIGGSLFHNKPMFLIREIVRRRIRGLTVIAVPQASMDVDLLIAAGCAAEIRVPYLGFEYLGLAMGHRRAAAEGSLRIWDCDETQLIAGLEATAKGMPSGVIKSGVGTDLPKINPALKVVSDPFTAEPVIAVEAIKPDVALIHAAAGDIYGNLRYAGYAFGDMFIAEATKRGGGTVIASVDEVVPAARAQNDPFRTDVPHMLVDHVVEAPYGAHPCSSHGVYQYDEDELSAYLAAAREGGEKLDAYIRQRVTEVPDQLGYLDRHLTPAKLVRMRKAIYV